MLINAILVFVVVIACTTLVQLLCTWLDDRKFPAPGLLVKIDDARMHVRKMGEGDPAVILEAGIAASTLNWSLLQPQLASLCSTYSYDRVGFGWSTGRDSSCSLPRIVDDLHATLTALQIRQPYILAGHSFASYVIGEYARRFTGELAGVVLVDPLTPEEWMHPTRFQRRMLFGGVWFSRIGAVLASLGVVRGCLWLLQRGSRRTPKGVLRLFGSDATKTVERILLELTKLPPDVLRLIRARWSTPRFFWTMAGYLGAIPRCSAEVHGHAIPAEVPVTVLSGAHQPETRLKEHAAIAAHSLRGRHLMADKSAHWIHLDQPELVTEAVREIVAAMKPGIARA